MIVKVNDRQKDIIAFALGVCLGNIPKSEKLQHPSSWKDVVKQVTNILQQLDANVR